MLGASLASPLTSILPDPDSPDPVVILRSAQDDKGWWLRLRHTCFHPCPSSIVRRPLSVVHLGLHETVPSYIQHPGSPGWPQQGCSNTNRRQRFAVSFCIRL